MPMPTCQIQWIDEAGIPTPDRNPAIMQVRTMARTEWHRGRSIQHGASEWFYICADHAALMNKPGMHIWECRLIEAA